MAVPPDSKAESLADAPLELPPDSEILDSSEIDAIAPVDTLLSDQLTGRLPKTLVDCVNLALQHNPQILIARQEIRKASGAVVTAKAVLYPNIITGVRAEFENRDLFEERELRSRRTERVRWRENWRVEVGIVQSLLTGGKNSNQIRAAQLEQEVEFLRLQETMNRVILSVKKAFFDVILARATVITQSQSVDLLRRELSNQQELFDSGRGSRFNIVRTEVRLGNEIPRLLEAENRVLQTGFVLSQLLGVDITDRIPELSGGLTGDFDCPAVDPPLEELIQEAIRRRPEPDRFQKLVQMEISNEAVAKAAGIPRLDAFATGRRRRDYGVGNSYFDGVNEAFFGLGVSWNVFDGFSSRGLAQQAEARAEINRIQETDSRRLIEIEVRQAWLKLEEAQLSIAAQEGNVARAMESLELASASVEAGRSTQFDILQSTVDLNTAETSALRARYNYHTALADLESAVFIFPADFKLEILPDKARPVKRPERRKAEVVSP